MPLCYPVLARDGDASEREGDAVECERGECKRDGDESGREGVAVECEKGECKRDGDTRIRQICD